MTKKSKTGRPVIKAKGRYFQLEPSADKELVRIAEDFGWTLTRVVEKSLLFSGGHKDFGFNNRK